MNATRAILTSAGLSIVLSVPVACSHEETMPQSTTTLTQGTLPGTSENAPTTPLPAAGTRTKTAASAIGPVHALFAAASTLSLPSSQASAVESIQDEIRGDRKQVRDAFGQLHQDLAAQVRAGAIDSTKLQGDATAAVGALDAHYNKETSALNQLHAALDPSQRLAAAETARTQLAEAAAARATVDERAWRLERLTSELGLDAAQQQQVSTQLAAQLPASSTERALRQSMAQQLLSAFEADTFDAVTALPAATWSPGSTVRAEIERRASFLSQLLPILRPDQRDLLATQLENREGPDQQNDD
jgi:hypothetical protein